MIRAKSPTGAARLQQVVEDTEAGRRVVCAIARRLVPGGWQVLVEPAGTAGASFFGRRSL